MKFSIKKTSWKRPEWPGVTEISPNKFVIEIKSLEQLIELIGRGIVVATSNTIEILDNER